MGSTFCPNRPSTTELDWSVLHAAKTAPVRAAGGPNRRAAKTAGRLSSDSSGTGFGPTTSLEEVGPVTGTDAGTDNGQAELPEGQGVSEETGVESTAERSARRKLDELSGTRPLVEVLTSVVD